MQTREQLIERLKANKNAIFKIEGGAELFFNLLESLSHKTNLLKTIFAQYHYADSIADVDADYQNNNKLDVDKLNNMQQIELLIECIEKEKNYSLVDCITFENLRSVQSIDNYLFNIKQTKPSGTGKVECFGSVLMEFNFTVEKGVITKFNLVIDGNDTEENEVTCPGMAEAILLDNMLVGSSEGKCKLTFTHN